MFSILSTACSELVVFTCVLCEDGGRDSDSVSDGESKRSRVLSLTQTVSCLMSASYYSIEATIRKEIGI